MRIRDGKNSDPGWKKFGSGIRDKHCLTVPDSGLDDPVNIFSVSFLAVQAELSLKLLFSGAGVVLPLIRQVDLLLYSRLSLSAPSLRQNNDVGRSSSLMFSTGIGHNPDGILHNCLLHYGACSPLHGIFFDGIFIALGKTSYVLGAVLPNLCYIISPVSV